MNNKSSSPSQFSKNNISNVLSIKDTTYLLEFVKLSSLPPIGKLNRMFNRIIRDEENVFPIFTEFIEERRLSRSITDVSEVFCGEDSETTYISALANTLLGKKYTSSQKDDFLGEIVNGLITKFSKKGQLHLGRDYIANKREDFRNISNALKINQTVTSLLLYSNHIGKNTEEDVKNLSDALKFNKTIRYLNLSDNYI